MTLSSFFMRWSRRIAACLAGGVVLLLAPVAAQGVTSAEVTVYTTREPAVVTPLLDAYSRRSGVRVNTVFVPSGLGERLAAEGAASPADLLLAGDLGELADALDAGLLLPVTSASVRDAVPKPSRDEGGLWVALSRRALLVYGGKELAGALPATYEGLADAQWRGGLCSAAGSALPFVSLVSAMIVKHGAERTAGWLAALRDNLARKPGGAGRDAARDLAAGVCDIAIAGSADLAAMHAGAAGEEAKRWADQVRPAFPRFADGAGTLATAAVAAVVKSAPHRAEAVKLLGWLVSPEGQRRLAETAFDYPIRADVAPAPSLAALGGWQADPTPLSRIAAARGEALRLIAESGFGR